MGLPLQGVGSAVGSLSLFGGSSDNMSVAGSEISGYSSDDDFVCLASDRYRITTLV